MIGKIQKAIDLTQWLPQAILRGPPLPSLLHIYWPWYKETPTTVPSLPPVTQPPVETPPPSGGIPAPPNTAPPATTPPPPATKTTYRITVAAYDNAGRELAGASVYIDGVLTGFTPLDADVEYGQHAVKTVLKGYQDASVAKIVGQDDVFNLTMVPPPSIPPGGGSSPVTPPGYTGGQPEPVPPPVSQYPSIVANVERVGDERNLPSKLRLTALSASQLLIEWYVYDTLVTGVEVYVQTWGNSEYFRKRVATRIGWNSLQVAVDTTKYFNVTVYAGQTENGKNYAVSADSFGHP